MWLGNQSTSGRLVWVVKQMFVACVIVKISISVRVATTKKLQKNYFNITAVDFFLFLFNSLRWYLCLRLSFYMCLFLFCVIVFSNNRLEITKENYNKWSNICVKVTLHTERMILCSSQVITSAFFLIFFSYMQNKWHLGT